MRRRDIILLLGGLASAWPAVARAQKSGMRRIGVLMSVSAEHPTGRDRVATFLQALRERGWAVANNVTIDFRWAEDRELPRQRELLRQYAAELVALGPDVILAGSGLAMEALHEVNRTVPVVFTATINPLAYVKSLSRPAGNATGFSNIEFDFSVKYLELLKEIAPPTTRVAVLRPPGFPSQFAAIKAFAPSLGVEVSPIEMGDDAEIERAIAEFAAEPNGGLIVTASSMATVHSKLIIDLTARHRLPALYPNRLHVAAGGLVSYGPAFLDQFRGAADYVDRILKGAKPGDLPVRTPSKYEMALNLKTAKALDLLPVPQIILVRADEIIE
jgi:putative tryptophan/tyrosine transport system substrate-binding protein